MRAIKVMFVILFTVALMGKDEEFGFLRYWAWIIIACMVGLVLFTVKALL